MGWIFAFMGFVLAIVSLSFKPSSLGWWAIGLSVFSVIWVIVCAIWLSASLVNLSAKLEENLNKNLKENNYGVLFNKEKTENSNTNENLDNHIDDLKQQPLPSFPELSGKPKSEPDLKSQLTQSDIENAIKGAIQKELPMYFKIKEATFENLDNIGTRQKIKFKITVETQENLYKSVNSNYVVEKIISEVGGDQSRMQSLVGDKTFYLLNKQASESFNMYGSLLANKYLDKIDVSYVTYETDLQNIGTPIVTGFDRSCVEADMFIKNTIAEFKDRKVSEEALRKKKIEELNKATSKGVIYLGIYKWREYVEKVILKFEENESDGKIIVFKIFAVNFPDAYVKCKGFIDLEQNNDELSIKGQTIQRVGGEVNTKDWRNRVYYFWNDFKLFYSDDQIIITFQTFGDSGKLTTEKIITETEYANYLKKVKHVKKR